MKFFQLSIVSLLFVACTQNANTDTSSDCIAKLDKDCICTAHYDPVCGCDGVTYGNACEANCNNVSYTEGECPDR